MPTELSGRDSLQTFADTAYGDRSPADIFTHVPPYEVRKSSEQNFQMLVRLPFTSKEEIKLTRAGQQLGIRVGPFRRSLALPRALASLPTQGAKMEDDRLVISFAGGAAANVSHDAKVNATNA